MGVCPSRAARQSLSASASPIPSPTIGVSPSTSRLKELTLDLELSRCKRHKDALASRLSDALHALDAAQGKVSGLALYEASLETILRNCHLLAAAGQAPPSAWIARLLDGASQPALVAYLQVAARDNEAANVLAQARILHALMRQGGSALDRGALIAFAAILCFSGRDPSLYASFQGAATPVTLRAISHLPPESEEDMLREPLLPVMQVYAAVLAGKGRWVEIESRGVGGGGAAACAVTATTSSCS